MGLSITAARARAVIADFLIVLASGSAFWFAINCPYHYDFSLCSRFGMTDRDYEALLVAADLAAVNVSGDFKIKHVAWTEFINQSGHFIFKSDKVRYDSKKTELEAHVEGRKVNIKKNAMYRVLRIGNEDDSTASNFLEQKDKDKKLIQSPPKLKQL